MSIEYLVYINQERRMSVIPVTNISFCPRDYEDGEGGYLVVQLQLGINYNTYDIDISDMKEYFDDTIISVFDKYRRINLTGLLAEPSTDF